MLIKIWMDTLHYIKMLSHNPSLDSQPKTTLFIIVYLKDQTTLKMSNKPKSEKPKTNKQTNTNRTTPQSKRIRKP